MARAALLDNFGEALGADKVKSIPLDWSPKAQTSSDADKLPDAFKRAEVWEIWDKETRSRVFVVNGFGELLRKDADPYGLAEFFPVAEPLQAVTANDTLIPVPEFNIYKDQADGLDEIESRIDRLTRALRRRGVYDATFTELSALANADDNQFVPVKNYADLSQKGGLPAAFQAEDIGALADVLAALHKQRDLRVQTIYEVIGIADIMRGASDPRETFGAQRIKAQFGGNRLKKRQEKIQRFVRDTLRIKAELIAEHFEPQTLAEMTGFALGAAGGAGGMGGAGPPNQGDVITPPMLALLRSDKLRSYRIDVETDSTMVDDAEAEKGARVELLRSLSEFVGAWVPVVQGQPALLPLAFELLSFGVRGFKAGRQLEETIDQTRLLLEQAAAQPRPADPQAEANAAKTQLDAQLAVLRTQAEITARGHELEFKRLELQAKREEMALKRQERHRAAQARAGRSPDPA
jgi:hypothetical protein